MHGQVHEPGNEEKDCTERGQTCENYHNANEPVLRMPRKMGLSKQRYHLGIGDFDVDGNDDGHEGADEATSYARHEEFVGEKEVRRIKAYCDEAYNPSEEKGILPPKASAGRPSRTCQRKVKIYSPRPPSASK